MDDVVAVIVTDRKRGEVGVLSWGRVFDAVDPTELQDAIRVACPRFGLHDVEDVRVCALLRDAKDFEYFFEGMLHFAGPLHQPGMGTVDWRMNLRDPETFARSLYVIGCRVT